MASWADAFNARAAMATPSPPAPRPASAARRETKELDGDVVMIAFLQGDTWPDAQARWADRFVRTHCLVPHVSGG
jgi:hypothetical protein